MPDKSISLNYKKITLANGAVVFRPIIRIELAYADRSIVVPCAALVDSGADWCFLKAEIGEILGINIESGELIEYQGISGEKAKGYIHRVHLVVANKGVDIPAIFTRNIPKGATQVVGQIGFFENFKVNFDYQKKSVVLRPKN